MWTTSVTITLLISWFFSAGAVRNVTVNKCCFSNETLTKDFTCVFSSDSSWNLNVFLPKKGGHLQNYKDKVPENWILREAYKPSCSNPIMLYANFYIPFKNGSLWHANYKVLISPEDYCLDYTSAMFCERNPEDMTKVKINKCCGPEAIFLESNMTCKSLTKGIKPIDIDVGPDKMLMAGLPDCSIPEYAYAGTLSDAEILKNGSILMEGMSRPIPVANYCLEHIVEKPDSSPTILLCKEHVLNKIKGKVEPSQSGSDLRFTLYPIGLAISAVFLAATLVAGSLLPTTHHVLHWRCQTNHVICLLVGDVLLCVTQVVGYMNHGLCIAVAVCMHFFFLAAFFWLNTMCFNIWWTFRDLRPQSNEKSQERCRLRIYHLYAWGVPLLIAGIALILDQVPSSGEVLKPGFAVNNCWFKGKTEILTFFFGPMGILLLTNLTLFLITTRELTCGLWKREYVKSTTERAALGRICIKLVVVMGITWIADIISWAVGGPQEIWYFSDLINCLQGVFIFMVVGFQKPVLSAIKRLLCMNKYRDNRTNGTTNHHSSSSQAIQSMGDTVSQSVTNNTTKSLPMETNC